LLFWDGVGGANPQAAAVLFAGQRHECGELDSRKILPRANAKGARLFADAAHHGGAGLGQGVYHHGPPRVRERGRHHLGSRIGGVGAEERTVGEEFQVVQLERCVPDGLAQVVETQLALDPGSVVLHVAVLARGHELERLFVGEVHKERVEGFGMVVPLDVQACAALLHVDEPSLHVHDHRGVEHKVRAQVLCVRAVHACSDDDCG